MEFGALVTSLPTKKGAVYAFDRGKSTRHSFSALAKDAARAAEDLRRWGVRPGDRVGIFAPNGYPWLVYDLAIIQIGAISVPFTEDFAGKIDRALLDKYQIALLLAAKSKGIVKEPHVAWIDGDNDAVQAKRRRDRGATNCHGKLLC